MTRVNRAANAAQAQRWNGTSGQYWIANRERHITGRRYLIPYLFDAADISSGERVLDIGCGCGETTIMAARAARRSGFNATGFAVGLDLSRPMLTVARQLAEQANVNNVRFVQGDAQIRPVRRESCNVIISSFGVMFFEDPAKAFTGLADAICPNGRLAFLCWRNDSQNELLAIPLQAFSSYMLSPSPAPEDLFVDPQQVTELLSDSGWRNIQIRAITEPAWMGSDVADVMSYVRGMPVVRGLAASLKDDMLSERVLATISEQYAARQRSDGVWVRAAAWLVTAIHS